MLIYFVTFQLAFHVDLQTIYLIRAFLEVLLINRDVALTGFLFLKQKQGLCNEGMASHPSLKNNPLISSDVTSTSFCLQMFLEMLCSHSGKRTDALCPVLTCRLCLWLITHSEASVGFSI